MIITDADLAISAVILWFIAVLVILWAVGKRQTIEQDRPRFLFFPLFMPKRILTWQASMNPRPSIYDEQGVLIPLCSLPDLHCIKGSRCVWCNHPRAEILHQDVTRDPESPPLVLPLARPDFLSPTSATVNTPTPALQDLVDQEVKLEAKNTARMDVTSVQAYCLRCKIKTAVIDPKTIEKDTRRGVRKYLTGTCAICKQNINAIAGGAT